MTVVANARTREHSYDGRFHWTVRSFYRAIEANVFDEPKRLELACGDLWEKEDLSPPHASLIRLVARRLRQALEPRFTVLQESPLHIRDDSEITPDIYAVRGTEQDYQGRHPGPDNTVLIVEVAHTSVFRDTHEKALLYAQTGIADYWLSLIPTRELLVFRSPTAEGYLETTRLTAADTVRPLVDPDIEFAVRDLVVRASSTLRSDINHQ